MYMHTQLVEKWIMMNILYEFIIVAVWTWNIQHFHWRVNKWLMTIKFRKFHKHFFFFFFSRSCWKRLWHNMSWSGLEVEEDRTSCLHAEYCNKFYVWEQNLNTLKWVGLTEWLLQHALFANQRAQMMLALRGLKPYQAYIAVVHRIAMTQHVAPRREVNNNIDFVGQGWATGALGTNKAKNCWAPWLKGVGEQFFCLRVGGGHFMHQSVLLITILKIFMNCKNCELRSLWVSLRFDSYNGSIWMIFELSFTKLCHFAPPPLGL